MSIVSSVIVEQQDTGDGIWVLEEHTDNFGNVYRQVRIYAHGDDPTTKVAEHAAALDAMLVDNEINGILG